MTLFPRRSSLNTANSDDAAQQRVKERKREKEARVVNDVQSVAEMDALTAKETREINILRAIAVFLLVTIAISASAAIYYYTASHEKKTFEEEFVFNAQHIKESFHFAVDRRLGAVNTLADQITSHALTSRETFPFLTLPHFEIHANNARIQGDTVGVHYMPLVTDETREEWEKYALAEREQIDVAFDEDTRLRKQQDEFFGLNSTLNTNCTKSHKRTLQQQIVANATILDDGTGYHPKIWSEGTETSYNDPDGTGPYLPFWQRR